MCFSSAAESKAEEPHLLGKSLLWGFLSSQEQGNPSFSSGICLVLLSQPSHSRSSVPCRAAPTHTEPGIVVVEEREAGKAAVRSRVEQLLTKHRGGGRGDLFIVGLLISVWVCRAEPDRT